MFDPVRNFAKVTVSAGYDASAVTITLNTNDGAKLPDSATEGPFNLIWWNSTDYPDPTDDPNREIVRCTARSTDTLTVTRGQEGTSGSTHNVADKVYLMCVTVTKKLIDDLNTNLPGMFKMGTATASYSGTWLSFSTPYYTTPNYKFFPVGYTPTTVVLVNFGDVDSGTKTISGLWVWPPEDNVTVDWITLGS